MAVPKAFYFCFFAAGAAFMPFLPLFYEGIGLSGRHIGLLVGIPPLISLASAPLWGGLADATQQHKRLLLLAIGGSLAAVLVLSTLDSFYWLLPVVLLYAFSSAPIMPLVDSTVLGLLGNNKDQYGKQRLWGAIGWGLTGPIIGILIQRTGLQWAFYGYLILMTVGLLVATRLSVRQARIGGRFWNGLQTLLANRQWGLFLATVFVAGIGSAIIHSFFFLYLDRMGASRSLMGLTLAVGTLSEMPILFFSDRLLRRWGARGMLIFSLAAYVIRVFAYSAIHVPWMVLPVQLLHGPTFSAMWVAGVSYADEIAPEGLGATAQSLFSSTTMGLGAAVGALIGGFLYDSVGPNAMFQVSGAGVLVGLLFFIFFERRAARMAPAPLEP
jgi:MFS transporter, PPP family, 3-phenylpropionic acid transporter